MRFNQYSYTKVSEDTMTKELAELGFYFDKNQTAKKNLKNFLSWIFFTYKDTDYIFQNWIADKETDLFTFFASDKELSSEIFYTVAFQLLDFVPFVDFESSQQFCQDSQFPITYGNLLENVYQLLNCRTKNGNTLIDTLISEQLIPEDNTYHFFNGKSLATFTSHDAIREVIYVESRVDTDQDGFADLIKVSIIRPRYNGKVPTVMTASPYHQGINDKASDQALHNMNTELLKKEPHQIKVETPEFYPFQSEPNQEKTQLVTESEEKLGHIDTYTLNDYFLPRGFATIYVSGVGTKDSQGLMTSGDYYQIEAFKNVIDWLNGRCRAFTSHSRTNEIKADWSNGKVATTGISYLGTLSNGLATTGVDGLEVIIAEAGISSWYNYYRENGLATSPGGYPGEDFESLTALTYSRNLRAGDFLKHNRAYLDYLQKQAVDLGRDTGDYNQFWHNRNYLLNADKVQAEVVFTHGTQDWNVKPSHVYQMFHALPNHVKKHLFLHHGAHVYMNNWQSIDFRESMNALLSKRLLHYPSNYELPAVIWQDNCQPQNWITLENFGKQNKLHTLQLGQDCQTIQNAYSEKDYQRFSQSYPVFKNELYKGKVNQITVDWTVEEDLFLNGSARLHLHLKSSIGKGLISAQLVDFGKKKRLGAIPSILKRRTMDNGRYHMLENLMELPFSDMAYRVISKGYLNLQNRTDLLTVEEVPINQWLDFSFELQPSIYNIKKGSQLRLVLYTTDFEITVRDQTDYTLTVDLEKSQLNLPVMSQ